MSTKVKEIRIKMFNDKQGFFIETLLTEKEVTFIPARYYVHHVCNEIDMLNFVGKYLAGLDIKDIKQKQ